MELEESLHSAVAVLNADRVVKVGGTFEKYIGEYKVSSDSYDELQFIKSSQDVLLSRMTYSVAFEEIGQNLTNGRGWGSFEWTENRAKKGCRRDRKIILTIDAYGQSYGGATQWFRQAELVAKKKGIPCIWYKYKTDITWNNFNFEYTLDGDYIYWTVPNTTVDNVKRIFIKDLISGNSNPNFDWKKAVTNAIHNGMAGEWLIVNENL